jgi:hypothetical protein
MMAIGLCQPFFSAFWVGNGIGGGRRIIFFHRIEAGRRQTKSPMTPKRSVFPKTAFGEILNTVFFAFPIDSKLRFPGLVVQKAV